MTGESWGEREGGSLVFVANDVCVLRFDNEAGKGDHRLLRNQEPRHDFEGVNGLLADFQQDIERIQHDDRDA